MMTVMDAINAPTERLVTLAQHLAILASILMDGFLKRERAELGAARTAVQDSTRTFLLTVANHVKLGSIALEERIIVKYVLPEQMGKLGPRAALRVPLEPCQVQAAIPVKNAKRESLPFLMRNHVKIAMMGSIAMKHRVSAYLAQPAPSLRKTGQLA